MVLQSLASPNTSNATQYEVYFDYYCTTLFVGPMVWGIFSVPCACVGAPASAWLLWVLIQKQRERLSNDIYMLNLTIMDLIFNVSTVPITTNYLFIRDEFISKLEIFLSCLNNTGKPILLAFICVDCYMAVICPITYRKMKDSKHRLVACSLSWGLTLFYGMIFALKEDSYVFYPSYLLMSYGLTVLTITFCDVSILYALRKPDPSGRTDVHPQKQRALQTIVNSFIITLIAYIPPLVIYCLFHVTSLTAQEVQCSLVFPALIFPRLGSTTMPLLHLGNLGRFKTLCAFQCFKF